MRLPRHILPLLALIVSVAAIALVPRLRLSPDVADLLPEQGQGAALRDYLRVFGRGDLAMLLIQGADEAEVRSAADDAARSLRTVEPVRAVVDRVELDVPRDPTSAWAMAGPRARKQLREALEPDGMRARIADTRRLLLAPGAASIAASVRADPLRLRQLPFESEVRIGGAQAAPSHGMAGEPSGVLVADEGRSRLLLISARGEVLRGEQARTFTGAVDAALAPVRSAHPEVRMTLTGGHAIAAETEQVLRRDLVRSGVLSTLLAALAFALTFRRLRALLAVLPPLALGTLWTAAAAGLAFGRVSALTLGFLAVVVGVGLDTGIHVYAALLEARRRGLAPAEAASAARRESARPTLVAALTAAIAFGTLALSSVPALRQFGLMCAAGEMLTALAILAVTPFVGAMLERGTPPASRTPRWVGWVDRMRSHHTAPLLLGIGVFVPLYVLFTLGTPVVGDKLVGIRPGRLPAVEAQQAVRERFGVGSGQWVVLLQDRDLERVRARADRLFEALDEAGAHHVALDALARFAPAPETQRTRLRERDALDLPARVPLLREALADAGFTVAPFTDALDAFAQPSHRVDDLLARSTDKNRLLQARYLAKDGAHAWAALYVQPRPGHEKALAATVESADSAARITGYARLEAALAESLRQDLPRVAWAAVMLVSTVLILTLRRGRDVAVALGALAFALLWVVALVRWLPLPVHLYNAFVLPVLLGITVDEVLFLLYAARGAKGGVSYALAREGPNVVATAATTAAGFAALYVCSFQGLRDMGMLGTIGVVSGLLAALWVVPVAIGRYTKTG